MVNAETLSCSKMWRMDHYDCSLLSILPPQVLTEHVGRNVEGRWWGHCCKGCLWTLHTWSQRMWSPFRRLLKDQWVGTFLADMRELHDASPLTEDSMAVDAAEGWRGHTFFGWREATGGFLTLLWMDPVTCEQLALMRLTILCNNHFHQPNSSFHGTKWVFKDANNWNY